MSKKTDSNGYTIVFAVVMVVVVGSLLALGANGLKDRIDANRKIEKQQNILYAMGVNDNEEKSMAFISKDKVQEAFDKYIVKEYVIDGTSAKELKGAYNSIDIKKEGALAKNENYKRKLPLFVGEKDAKKFYIIPLRGKGLWDAIWGYVSLDENLTVQGVFFDHKGETPGLGSNITQRYFMDDFIGESLFQGNAFVGIKVAKGNADPKNEDKMDNEVDALAGATITGNGVSDMIKNDLRMYMPYLKTLKK